MISTLVIKPYSKMQLSKNGLHWQRMRTGSISLMNFDSCWRIDENDDESMTEGGDLGYARAKRF
jgi:hypothetical protein